MVIVLQWCMYNISYVQVCSVLAVATMQVVPIQIDEHFTVHHLITRYQDAKNQHGECFGTIQLNYRGKIK